MGSSNAYWLIKDHVVYVHNVGDLTGDDFRAVDVQIRDYLSTTYDVNPQKKIHVLVDNSDLTKLPRLKELEGGRILKYLKEKNVGTTIVMGYKSNPFLRVLSPLLTSVMGANLSMTDTLDDAIAELKKIDKSIINFPDLAQWKEHNLS